MSVDEVYSAPSGSGWFKAELNRKFISDVWREWSALRNEQAVLRDVSEEVERHYDLEGSRIVDARFEVSHPRDLHGEGQLVALWVREAKENPPAEFLRHRELEEDIRDVTRDLERDPPPDKKRRLLQEYRDLMERLSLVKKGVPRYYANPGEVEEPLCPEHELEPFIIENFVPNPSIPTSDEPNAYMDLADITKLVMATLAFLDVKISLGRGANEIECAWMTSITKTGLAEKMYERMFSRDPIMREGRPVGYSEGWMLQPRFRVSFSRQAFSKIPVQNRVVTIIHEACHVAAYVMYPDRNVGHGNEWKSLMIRCGTRPDVRTEAAKGVGITFKCSRCGFTGRLTAGTVVKMRSEHAVLRCRKCGTVITNDDIDIPQSEVKRLKSAEARPRHEFFCRKCNDVFPISPKQLGALQRGAKGRCGRCDSPMDITDVRLVIPK